MTYTTELADLLPCPFCGTQPVVEQTGFSGRARYIYCNLDDCLRPKAVGENEEAAVRSWNTRVALAVTPAEDREFRTGAHILQTAKSLGWPDDGEGALEFMLRLAREVAFGDCAVSKHPSRYEVRNDPNVSAAVLDAMEHFWKKCDEYDRATPAVGGDAQFLLDRLEEYDPEDEDHVRDFHGHVAPAIARLRNALAAQPASPLRIKEATAAQHFDLPKGEPARFVRNGILETCQCTDCAALTPPASPLRGREEFVAFVKRAGFTDWSRYGEGYAKPLIDRMWSAWSPTEQPAADQVTERSYCALCDLECELHEDAQGFHHVIKGERVPCFTAAFAALPASPLRGREWKLQFDPVFKQLNVATETARRVESFVKGEVLRETTLFHASESANQIMAVASTLKTIIRSIASPPEQPAADPTGRMEPGFFKCKKHNGVVTRACDEDCNCASPTTPELPAARPMGQS